ncbi:hypothetical protein VL4N_00410 [Vagococcus lutrae]|nr:hypothetical protein VL2N_01730 [Vagococcus lutrae]GEQ62731.1 hypothetical protein VL3N_01730 [Vagococcus lutrae]GEQ64491.1 hypothetical protein VL4N_00410 [Vagococcus lutrae]
MLVFRNSVFPALLIQTFARDDILSTDDTISLYQNSFKSKLFTAKIDIKKNEREMLILLRYRYFSRITSIL